MACRFRSPPLAPGLDVQAAYERVGGGVFYDFGDGTFKAEPAELFGPAAEVRPADLPGIYGGGVADTPAEVWLDAAYAVYLVSGGAVLAVVPVQMFGGSDVLPYLTAGSGDLPWTLQQVAAEAAAAVLAALALPDASMPEAVAQIRDATAGVVRDAVLPTGTAGTAGADRTLLIYPYGSDPATATPRWTVQSNDAGNRRFIPYTP